jgi:hypothetical protein
VSTDYIEGRGRHNLDHQTLRIYTKWETATNVWLNIWGKMLAPEYVVLRNIVEGAVWWSNIPDSETLKEGSVEGK